MASLRLFCVTVFFASLLWRSAGLSAAQPRIIRSPLVTNAQRHVASHTRQHTVLLAVSDQGSFSAANEGADLDAPAGPAAQAAPASKAAPAAKAAAVPTAAVDKTLAVAAAAKAIGNVTSNGNSTSGGFLMNVTSDQLTYAYTGILPIVIIVVIIFEFVNKRWAGIDLNEPIPDLNRESDAGQGMQVGNWLSGFWPLTREFFVEGPMAGTAKLLIGVLLFLSFWSLFMDWARNIWQRDFWDAIEAKHVHKFWKAMLLFVLMAVVNVLSSTYQGYTTSILTIRWRATLTKNLQEKWLMRRAFCVQHFPQQEGGPQPLDNPDQRIQEDVDGFVNGGLNIFFGTFMCVGRLALFVPILFMLSPTYAFGIWYCPGWLLYVSLLYSGFGCLFTHKAGQWLIPLSYIKQQVEADYRHTAVQVRDNTESIAMYGSEATEHNRLLGRLERIQRVVWEQMKYSKQLGFFRNFYFLLNDIAPFCILAANYFKGQITLGQMMQVLGALGHVSDSLNAFVQAYTDIADLRATTDRLYGFSVAVEEGAKFVESATMSKEVGPPGDMAALSAQSVCVRFSPKYDDSKGVSTPDEAGSEEEKKQGDRTLWSNAGLVVQPGERVLLLGPDGCGKSVFLRAIAGCWPATGSVRIGRGDALFVPQRPFVPAGQLREALSYPDPVGHYTDEEIQNALSLVNLSALDKVSLSEHADWQRRLSGGELQRLALAHALLRKPGLLVLDETTAAIGEEGTRELYACLEKNLPTSTAVISVDHDAIREVGSWHNVHYTIDQSEHKWIPSPTSN